MYLLFEPKIVSLLPSADSQFNKIKRSRTYGLPCKEKGEEKEESMGKGGGNISQAPTEKGSEGEGREIGEGGIKESSQ